MAIDLEKGTVQGLNAFVGFVLLNLLHLVCCLPLVTAGAATSALLEVTARYADQERGHLLRDYLRALVADFSRATLAHLVLGAPLLALLFAARFWITLGGPLSLVMAVVAALAALYLLGAWIHAMALVALFRAPLAQTLRNALLLPGAEPLRTAGIVLVPLLLLALALVVPGAVWVVLTIGVSVGGYVAALLLRGVHRRFQPVV
jgi:uncharacterized membrane protein YesL